MLSVSAIDHIVINTSNPQKMAEWYVTVLGMKHQLVSSEQGDAPRNILLFGKQKINLRPIEASQKAWFTADNPSQGACDLCFLVDISPDQVVEHLKHHDIEIELGPVVKQGARGAINSVYCRDPDKNLIEISSYID